MNRPLILAAGLAATLGFAAAWHGPLGAAAGFAARSERLARATLDHYEMTRVQAHVMRGPMKRVLVLSGPADTFQHAELVRILDEVPGIVGVGWATQPTSPVTPPVRSPAR